MNSEKSLPLSFLEQGMSECLYEPAKNLNNVLDRLQSGFSLPGLLISVRLERIPYRMSVSIVRDIETNHDVFQSLISTYSENTKPSVSYLNMFDFGTVRFSAAGSTCSSMSSSFKHFHSLLKCYNDVDNSYRAIMGALLSSKMVVVADLELHHLNAEVDSFLDFVEAAGNHKTILSRNFFDERVAILYQLEVKYKELKAVYDEKAANLEEMVSRNENADAQLNGARAQLKDLENALADAQEIHMNTKNEASDAEKEVKRLKSQLSSVESELEKVTEEKVRMEKTFKKDLSNAKKSQQDLDKKDSELEAEIASLAKENEQLKVQIERMKKESRKFEKENEKLKAQNQELHEAKTIRKSLSPVKKPSKPSKSNHSVYDDDLPASLKRQEVTGYESGGEDGINENAKPKPPKKQKVSKKKVDVDIDDEPAPVAVSEKVSKKKLFSTNLDSASLSQPSKPVEVKNQLLNPQAFSLLKSSFTIPKIKKSS